jgi:hypothetical protein
MSDLSTISSTKSKYADQTIIHAGNQAYELVITYQPAVEPRLPPSTVLDLAADLQAVGTSIPAAKQAQAETAVSIATQRRLLGNGMKLLRGIRQAVRKNTTDRDVRKAYGIGQRVNPKVAKDIISVLGLIRDRAAKQPAEAASLGIAQKDLDAVKKAIADIGTAFNARQKQEATAPLTTKTRNQVLNRIVLAVGRISTAGKLEFVDQPEIANRFADVALPPLPRKKSAAKPAAAKPAKKPATKAAPAAPEPPQEPAAPAAAAPEPPKEPAAPVHDAGPAPPATPEAPPVAA